jgi:hypothetical protein
MLIRVKIEPSRADGTDKGMGSLHRGRRMTRIGIRRGRSARWNTLSAIFAFAALGLGTPPAAATAGPAHDLGRWADAFTQVCSELSSARMELREGHLNECSFADRVVELFAQADSLRATLESMPSGRRPGPVWALDRGIHYLILSLRENYVGIVERDGLRFVSADQALKAAVAWRSGTATAAEIPDP